MRRALFRVDASLQIGSGHLMRCVTLARALQQSGWQLEFICRQHPGHFIDWLPEQGFAVFALPLMEGPLKHSWLGATQQADAAAVQALNRPFADLLVIDHYGLSAEFSQALAGTYQKLLVIDDLANRPQQADWLLDQNLLPDATQRYSAWVAPHTKLLLGPAFALLRAEFAQTPLQRGQTIPRILVFFGGSDVENFSKVAIDALQGLQNSTWLADIVVGQANPHQTMLQQRCARDPRLTLHIQTPGMAGLMAKADLMVGAGGATHWERCAMGLPALVVAVADNQQATTAYLAELGACINLGSSAEFSATALSLAIDKLLADPTLRQQMSQQASALVPKAGGCPAIVNIINQAFV